MRLTGIRQFGTKKKTLEKSSVVRKQSKFDYN